MNRDGFLTVLLAVCCIAAAGIASTTLASSLSQDPDDVVNVDYSKLPLGKDQGRSIRSAVQNEEGSPPKHGGSASETTPSDPAGERAADDGERSVSPPDTDAAGQQPDAGSGQSGQRSSGNGPQSETRSQAGSGSSGTGPGDGTVPAPVSQLWSLLERLLPLLVALVALALAYRYRRRLLALALAVAAAVGDSADRGSGAVDRWPTERPTNEVHRAWLRMVDRLDVDRPWTRTPSECAAAAMEADLDPRAVQTLTEVFEEVRYAEKPVTDERRARAREGLRRLDGGESQ